MGELAVTLGILLCLGTTAVVFRLPWDQQFFVGPALLVIGGLAGLPTSALYHVQLRRHLSRHGALPPRWWLSPTPLHGRLSDAERRAVMPWFYAGAMSFAVTVSGGLLALVAAWRAR